MKPSVADYRTRVLCLRIVPKTGSPIRLTHYQRDLVMASGTVYLSGSGYEFTGYSATAGLSPAMIDLTGIAGVAGISEAVIASGRLDGARCYLFATRWNAPVEDEEPIVASLLGKTTLMDARYRIEEMALIDALNQTVGKTYTAQCPKTFGGTEYAGCGKALGPLTVGGVLSGVTSKALVRDAARTEALDWFAAGTIAFTSGANAGLKPLEIKSYLANGTIEVFEPFTYLPAIGDTYTMIPGCRKRLDDCKTKWNNVLNFGGFSHVPTGGQYFKVGRG